MFALGLFLGSLIYKKACLVNGISTPHATHSTPSLAPVYDEIPLPSVGDVSKLKKNEAYGIFSA